MSKLSLPEKFFDVRTMTRYARKGNISAKDIDEHYKALPNDEGNFELSIIEDDDIGVGEELSEDELKALPPMTEDDIDNFDFMGKSSEDSDQEE
jgi:hypothetical protein